MADAAEIEVAHVLRRVCLGPRASQVDRWRDEGVARLIDWAIEADALPSDPAEGIGPDDYDPLLAGWLRQLRNPAAGLHERMTWFWHGHFTTSADKVGSVVALWRQQRLLRRHAMGNFRELVRALATDAAMLRYLDGDGSVAEAPNENFARELMELFTLGRGAYGEPDVRAAAQALAGWSVDHENGDKVRFTQDDALQHEVDFLGRRGRFGVDEVVDLICNHEACAPFIATKLHTFLVGTAPDEGRTADLARTFRSHKLEIRPLVAEIVSHPSFRNPALVRPRYPAEWLAAALAATGNDGQTDTSDHYWFEQIGQVPYRPPNVAGWPGGPRWLSASQALARAGLVAWMNPDPLLLGPVEQVAAVLRRCLLFDVSASTRSALDGAARSIQDDHQRALALFTLALTSPEFSLL